MSPKDFTYYRINESEKDNEFQVPSVRTYEEMVPLLAASVRSVPATIKRLMQGKKVKTKYAIYWAVKTLKTL